MPKQSPLQIFIEAKYGTTSEFARRIGVTWMTANKYVKGRQPLRLDQVNLISDQTGIPTCEILNILNQ
jgi:hypothetical protein